MSEVEKALTREEWEALRVWIKDPWLDPCVEIAEEGGELEIYDDDYDHGWNLYHVDEKRHEIAALALHEQEFGFSWHDVDVLRRQAVAANIDGVERRVLMKIAQRIAALLPPREE